MANKSQAGAQRIIKKYPNRRLYDTQTSSYITLEDVKVLVLQHEPIKIIDVKNEEDLTRSVLMQIILEEEASGMPLFSTAMLENLIRFYGNTLQGLMGNYLEKMTQSFVDMQKNLTDKIPAMDHSKNFAPELWSKLVNVQTPLIQGMMDHYLEQSRMMLVQVQQQMVNPVAPPMFDPFAMMSGIHPPVVVKRKPPKNQES